MAALDEAAQAFDVRLDVLIEVNVGMDRCGIEPGEPALALARQVAGCRGLRLAGLQAYHGAAQHVRRYDDRRAPSSTPPEGVGHPGMVVPS